MRRNEFLINTVSMLPFELIKFIVSSQFEFEAEIFIFLIPNL